MSLKENILQLHEQGYTNSQIVEKLNCSKSNVSYHIRGRKTKQEHKKDICECGNKKRIQSERCNDCNILYKRELLLSRTLLESQGKNKNDARFSNVRASARMFMEEWGIEYKCSCCDFSEYVEVHHIKPISSFDLSATIREVNSKENLIYLCPNCHILFERGKLDISKHIKDMS